MLCIKQHNHFQKLCQLLGKRLRILFCQHLVLIPPPEKIPLRIIGPSLAVVDVSDVIQNPCQILGVLRGFSSASSI